MSFTQATANTNVETVRLPREVWIGSISAMGLRAENSAGMVEQVLKIMENLVPYNPDIVCLPEGFAFGNIAVEVDIKAVAEREPGPILRPFMAFAKEHQCYVICPTYTKEGEDVFISAVLIDRTGAIAGEYRKTRPTSGEIESGVRPGPLEPPVFETDFGKIGIQICFDIKWEDGWKRLKEQGAEIIFWPSAYAGGREIASRAWRHQVSLVSSTQKDTSKICDLTEMQLPRLRGGNEIGFVHR